MAQFLGRDEKESLGTELAELGRSIGSPFHHHTSSFRSRTSDAKSYKEKDDEVDLQWAAIERLPTFERVRTSLFGHHGLNDGKEELGKRVIHVTKLGALECNVFIDKLLKKIEENNHQLLQKLREGMDRQAAPLFLCFFFHISVTPARTLNMHSHKLNQPLNKGFISQHFWLTWRSAHLFIFVSFYMQLQAYMLKQLWIHRCVYTGLNLTFAFQSGSGISYSGSEIPEFIHRSRMWSSSWRTPPYSMEYPQKHFPCRFFPLSFLNP